MNRMQGLGVFKIFHKALTLGFTVEHKDEEWEYSEEPHVSRRQEILKKYPEIKKLMGCDPSICYIVAAEVALQMLMCYLVKDASWFTVFISTYVISASLNHSLGSAIHEIGHNLAFGHKRPLANRLLGMFCNLPMAVPMSVTYKKYHTDHHRWLGHETMDVDIPTALEATLFKHPITKMLWLLFHPFIHAVRPFYKSPKPLTTLELTNTAVQLSFDVLIYYTFGFKALIYLLMGTLFGTGFHPLAGHFISEHYLYNKGQSTHSYYGPLNPLLFNVGYHVEHHDFPYIPYRRLPKVRKIAAEFYDDLPYHTSWLKVLYDFIFEPSLGPHARGVNMINKEQHDVSMKENYSQMLPSQTVEVNGNEKKKD